MNTSKIRKKKKLLILIISLCCVLSPAIAGDPGDSYNIKRHVIANGGGISSSVGGVYKVHATIGQPVTGQSQSVGGQYSIQIGFWHARREITEEIFKNSFEAPIEP